ncbi:probable RNA-binding protein EIF1AD isoform X1 [Hyla sarda]|uniref:probable RNA-binding protein EIF1AD isoform X1 n=1 Tax=Hyla sarda TaxID=327740 RepID=UPI0024C34C19|nr:probable RNA-binding protein EIF1AD isoform X1 [Hyla sarda]XP_056383308.1 probable RNA-binding protein EIF1AD isoform X1 [Hyla sarda]
MSKTTKRKHVVKEVLLDYVQPTANQRIVKILGSPGNNLHEVETAEGERFLASMPTKFRKNIWIKRGDFVIVDPIAEGEKVKAEIAFILYKDHQRLLQKEGLWPSAFNKEDTESPAKEKERCLHLRHLWHIHRTHNYVEIEDPWPACHNQWCLKAENTRAGYFTARKKQNHRIPKMISLGLTTTTTQKMTVTCLSTLTVSTMKTVKRNLKVKTKVRMRKKQ